MPRRIFPRRNHSTPGMPSGRLDAWAFKKWKNPNQFDSVQQFCNIAGIIGIILAVLIILVF